LNQALLLLPIPFVPTRSLGSLRCNQCCRSVVYQRRHSITVALKKFIRERLCEREACGCQTTASHEALKLVFLTPTATPPRPKRSFGLMARESMKTAPASQFVGSPHEEAALPCFAAWAHKGEVHATAALSLPDQDLTDERSIAA
jgi:hypothetical protein